MPQAPQKTAERIERRLRLRVTASDVDATAQQLWSRSLDAERERRVTDRHALTGGSLKTIRGHVSRDLDREIAYEMERNPERAEPASVRPGRDEPGRGDLGGHPPQHRPGQQGLQRQRRHPVVELHPARRARRPDHRRGVEGRGVRGGEPADRVAARQARHAPTPSTSTSRPPGGTPTATGFGRSRSPPIATCENGRMASRPIQRRPRTHGTEGTATSWPG